MGGAYAGAQNVEQLGAILSDCRQPMLSIDVVDLLDEPRAECIA
jgi:hypothetical protein